MGVGKYGSFEQKGLKTLKQAWNPHRLRIRRYFLYVKGGTIGSSSPAVQDDKLIGITNPWWKSLSRIFLFPLMVMNFNVHLEI